MFQDIAAYRPGQQLVENWAINPGVSQLTFLKGIKAEQAGQVTPLFYDK